MANVSEITCKFCGKTRSYRWSDRTPDMDGRNYIDNSWCDDKGCDCDLGKAKFNKFKLKKMCMNCKYNIYLECTNENMMNELSSQFKVSKLEIKSETKCCKHWEVSENLIEEFV